MFASHARRASQRAVVRQFGSSAAPVSKDGFIWGGKAALGTVTFVGVSSAWYTQTSSGRGVRKSIGKMLGDDKWDDGLWPGVAAVSVVGMVLSTFYWS